MATITTTTSAPSAANWEPLVLESDIPGASPLPFSPLFSFHSLYAFVHTSLSQGTRFKSRGRHNRATMPTDTCSRRPSGRPRTMWVVCYPGPPQRSSISSVAPSSAPLLLVRAPPQCVSRACCG
jgi:hypothetical protein